MALTYATIPLQVQGVSLNISTIHNLNSKPPTVFLHGFESCKEDLADIVVRPAFKQCGYLAFDAPGCGHSESERLSATDISFLIEQFHLIGHSMGGLTALLLAHRHPSRVLSFVDIKGNLAPEDCFLSRQIFLFPTNDPEAFLNAFIVRTATAKSYGSPLYASILRARVCAGAVRAIFESIMFMFGEENRGLSYLAWLGQAGVELAEIEDSGQFPMFSNPVEMYRRIGGFLKKL
ncbi:alpha/beta fold hydrolase [Aspergillus homomorphus CBS 101889]|uniref:Putative alpha/beta hydrolase n=1 Tax=Aspergillus homomorphus (strain CBS 101889) TaxID=1450537 RepID=A0A395HPJ1_ASPHC|nr:putative alpha/beta hydrolase [Aspergillus homomorphus CBS 101889]RAL09409.1 putative alpha/beta hydrolase [Aspergillus homomorphus CBS 101889]